LKVGADPERRFVVVLFRSWFRFFLVVNGLGEMEFAYLFGSLLGGSSGVTLIPVAMGPAVHLK
jgi:hypothetical protein